jgi:hypothetical protein
MNALQEYIGKLNEEATASATSEGYSLFGTIAHDLAHWNSMGVFTPEDFDRYMLESRYYNMFKDVYGCRPYISAKTMSEDELNEHCSRFAEMIEDELTQEALRDQEFENELDELLELGAEDRDTALRWMIEGSIDVESRQYGGSFVCYLLNVGEGFATDIDRVLESMR